MPYEGGTRHLDRDNDVRWRLRNHHRCRHRWLWKAGEGRHGSALPQQFAKVTAGDRGGGGVYGFGGPGPEPGGDPGGRSHVVRPLPGGGGLGPTGMVGTPGRTAGAATAAWLGFFRGGG